MAFIQPSAEPAQGPARNADFANRARSFVNRALALPGMPILPLASLAGAIAMIVVGGFGTGGLPLTTRMAFWVGLMAINAVKWQLWFIVTIHRPSDWWRSIALASVILNLSLPFEIAGSLALCGIKARIDLTDTWTRALAISAVVAGLIVVLRQYARPDPLPAAAVKPVLPPLLAKAGIPSLSDLTAIVAEDHYCRLHRADGRSVLIHQRFGDALAAVALVEGAQVHRGVWVAASAVIGAQRDGRRWRLVVGKDLRLPVSARFVATARARGWLRPADLPGIGV